MEDMFLNTVGAWVVGFLYNYPYFAIFMMGVGFLRLTVKPAMTILREYVKMTPYDSDDKWLLSMEESKGYKLGIYILDWFASVKLPEKK